MFDADKFIQEAIASVKEKTQGRAIIACSGGVDSSVSAVIAGRAMGDRLLAVFVDTGLMRKGEAEEVEAMFSDTGINFKSVDASKEYFDALKGITEPEQKRKAIGEKFIRIFEREAKEPLRDLYKDEVRQVARKLGIKSSERQPFPGPGLAVRCLAEVTPENIAVVREACFIVEDEIRKAAEAGKMKVPWQYFAVLLPARSVGVQGDRRAYGRTIAVRAVESIDGMTAAHSDIPLSVLNSISQRITSRMKDEVNRVVYDITDKPPATIEWE